MALFAKSGILTKITESQLTVEDLDGSATRVSVTSRTRVRRSDSPSSVDDLTIGETVEILVRRIYDGILEALLVEVTADEADDAEENAA